jgi:hypothetical protein
MLPVSGPKLQIAMRTLKRRSWFENKYGWWEVANLATHPIKRLFRFQMLSVLVLRLAHLFTIFRFLFGARVVSVILWKRHYADHSGRKMSMQKLVVSESYQIIRLTLLEFWWQTLKGVGGFEVRANLLSWVQGYYVHTKVSQHKPTTLSSVVQIGHNRRPNSWGKKQTKVLRVFLLAIYIPSLALLCDFYFFKLKQCLTVSTVKLLGYTVK